MTEIPHPSNVTDHDKQRSHYYRQIAEQLARIGDVLEGTRIPSKVPHRANMIDRDQLQTYNLRQVAVQLARTADALEAESAAREKAPATRKRRPPTTKAVSN
ncbi:MAG: hypothetical protein QOK05_102 [Chloroflexota bacterium]|jgi:hypothetical protein|nr:hypothetical protein [Chloroflexota bacterium]